MLELVLVTYYSNQFTHHWHPETDLIVCSSKGQTEPEHHNYTKQLFKLCESIKRKQHKSLLYLIESPCHNCTEEQCSCTCDSRLGNDCKRKIVCNWSLAKEVSSLKEQGASVDLAEAETTLGMPRQCASSSGKCITLIHMNI
jgi:hypothetical protein